MRLWRASVLVEIWKTYAKSYANNSSAKIHVTDAAAADATTTGCKSATSICIVYLSY